MSTSASGTRTSSRRSAMSRKCKEHLEEDNSSTGISGTEVTLASKLRKRMLTDLNMNEIKSESRGKNTTTLDTESQNICSKKSKRLEATSAVNQGSSKSLGLQIAGQKTDFICNFESRKSDFVVKNSVSSLMSKSMNMFHLLYKTNYGMQISPKQKHTLTNPVVNQLSEFGLCRCATPFDRRTTAMEWHPSNPNILAVGSKGGDIILWDSSTITNDKFIGGDGAGGSIQAMKFWPWNNSFLCTASINGKLTLHDFEGRHGQILSDTMNCMDFWYCSLDVSSSHSAVLTGDNVGNILCLSEKGQKVWNKKLHKQKVTHVEFSPRENWLFCSASVDHTVRLWDIRMIKDNKSSLAVLQHNKGVNSAYFSLTNGCRLLTTDQHSDIKIFSAPEWRLERTVHHPHRFFQHITPIKASWHPLQDLIVVGRYPDQNFPGYKSGERRTIDIIDSETGEVVTKLFDPSAPGIVSLNKFNHSGEALASGMGVNILLWNRKELIAQKQEKLKEKMTDFKSNALGIGNNDPSKKRTKTDKKTKTDSKTKLSTKLKNSSQKSNTKKK
ncbi:DNA damage-binding protein 2 [Patella vulgata]|uniref:DNA damage-binding protein 2 n=1 Tax=Patella vulgata TaxID=6465 RepID=UPI00217FC9BE|nr:DNA damage-binding protein 2 [Patella vulgata]